MQATRKKNVLRKVEGVTPAARRQFRLDERKRLESLQKAEEEIAMEGLGKLLVSRPRELLMPEVQPGPAQLDVGGAEERRRRQVMTPVCFYNHTDLPPSLR